jgi:transcriptional regulator with XRE-family HTH domain
MRKNLKQFGQNLKRLRIAQNLSLREICKKVNYDASNWSKVERGVISPPSESKILASWARVLGLKPGTNNYEEFVDRAQIAQGIIPEDILSGKHAAKHLPAVFRTLRNDKPTKKEIDQLIELIRNS